MAGIRPVIISMLVVGAFTWCLIMFGIAFPLSNGSNQSLLSSPLISNASAGLNASLQNVYASAQNQSNAYENDQPAEGFSYLIFNSIIGAWITFKTLGLGMFNVVINLVKNGLFGSNFSPIFNLISAIVMITLVFLAYKLAKSGESDR